MTPLLAVQFVSFYDKTMLLLAALAVGLLFWIVLVLLAGLDELKKLNSILITLDEKHDPENGGEVG